jgi:hypothetical protein
MIIPDYYPMYVFGVLGGFLAGMITLKGIYTYKRKK